MVLLLAAVKVRPEHLERVSRLEGGITLTSAPVSTRKLRPDTLSRMNKRRLLAMPAAAATNGGRRFRFPEPGNRRVDDTDELWHQNECGRNTDYRLMS